MTRSASLTALFTILFIGGITVGQMTVRMDGYGPYRKGSGGEFSFNKPVGWGYDPLSMYDSKVKNGNYFQTFCLEHNEYIYRNSTYNVALSKYASNGGTNSDSAAVAHQDNISVATAWLFENFAQGTLDYQYEVTGYTGGVRNRYLRKLDAQALQKAIWYFEDEITCISNKYTQLANAQFTDTKADYAGTTVQVMNLTRLNGNRAQDQLVLGPPSGPPVVPVPSALILASAGVLVTGFVRRKHM